jgi:hypothetical protein
MGLLLATALVALKAPERASAHNDACTTYSQGWVCQWFDRDLQPATRHWFSAANTNRDWDFAGVADAYDGAVANKCVNIKRHGDGAIFQIACGPGVPDDYIPNTKSPGYLFNVHNAPGARYITSEGYH